MSVSLTVVATGWTGAELRVGEGNSVHTTRCAALITSALRPLRLNFSSSLLSLVTLRRATCPFLRFWALNVTFASRHPLRAFFYYRLAIILVNLCSRTVIVVTCPTCLPPPRPKMGTDPSSPQVGSR